MDLGLGGKAALVTGGSRGIGKAVAETLLREGASVAICARDAEALHQTVADLTKIGPQVLGRVADVTDVGAVAAFVEAAMGAFGRVDILVNNAGTHLRGTVDDTTEAVLERQLHEKAFGFFLAIRAVMPTMKAQRDGRIVNVIGQAARHPHPDRFPSGVTNAALLAITKSAADALARHNIRVNSVCPQYIETGLLASLIDKEMRERGVDRAAAAAGFTRANVLGRLGQPGEVADLVAFLASDRAKFVTGSSVSIDGGYHRYVFG
ncbi:MAG TPA: SDR family oxidoreductase [Hyphomicrobiaceae bacterium]|jgi:NAD(P)-dependent dehydrogenase (short-subunit alcohol dehydrogenase family)|nr:SDR family oxidoreductase [Hyphomicrobiaceae bacterium]